MEPAFYLPLLGGSFSLGYALLRAGFPKTQGMGAARKAALGYALGAIVFVPAMAAAQMLGEKWFFPASGALFACIFGAMIARRILAKERDSVLLAKEKKAAPALPRKALTEEEKSKDRCEVVSEKKIKGQIFKEKEPNVIAEVREKTSEMEKKRAEEEKEAALKRLRSFARDIKGKGPRAAEKKRAADDELEEMLDFGEDERL